MAPLRTRSHSAEPRQLALPIHAPAGPEFVFVRVFRRLGIRRAVPDFHIEYRPFSSLRSNIALQGNHARVHISDVLAEAPTIVLEALAEILLTQLFRRQASEEARECYMAYVFDPAVRSRVDEARRTRGRVRLLPARGHHYDLAEIYSRLNRRLFNDELAPCRIGWSTRASRTVLGRYDPAHHTITISKSLDAESIPLEIVEYLVFHEMLHIRIPLERNGSRRVVHSRAFHEAEKAFPNYRRVRERLKKIFSQ
ncbi:MAG TPA: SprT-like domain-containing protein [Terriglobia bacterium]|nr:SprT-like domain-containing protein [Terriglobia bacterium]